jgi:AcrR family transcriptional regulator
MTNDATAADLGKLPLQWVRAPQQARTHATLGKMLDSAEALLAESSWDAVSVSQIARRAGSSVGAFYRRFKDKDGLLHAMHERFVDEAMATAETALDPLRWADASLAELCEELFGFVVQVLRERHGLDRAAYERALFDDIFAERSARLTKFVMTKLAELLLARRHEITHPEPEVAVDVSLRQAFSLITETCTVRMNDFGLLELDDAKLVREMTRALTSYLGVRND